MKKVLIIGPSPTRIGGVSAHISRLTYLLRDKYDFDYIDEGRGKIKGFYNLRSFNIAPYFCKMRGADIVHIHSGVFILRTIHIVIAKKLFRKNVIVSIHRNLEMEGHIETTKRLLKQCNCAILDSQVIYDSMFEKHSKCVYRMMPAFLPPIESEEEQLPERVSAWIKKVREDTSSILMCSNASDIIDFNGVDLYGNDMCIDSVRELNEMKNEKNFYLVLIIHNTDRNPDKLKWYQEKIARESCNNILLITSPVSFVQIMKASDIVLRPTNTDGDSITIREALYYSKATVASDCTKRPAGTYVFKTRDLEDFCNTILNALELGPNQDKQSIDYKAFYTNCYEKNSGVRK